MPSSEVERMETARRKRQALEMRLESKSYRVIAETLNCAVDTVRAWVREGVVANLPEEETEELRKIEASKIDLDEEHALTCIKMYLTQADRKQSEGENIDAELEGIRRWKETLMSLRKQRALLLGLNRPILVNHNIKVRSTVDEEIESLVTQLLGGGNIMSDPERVDIEPGDANA